MAEAAFWMVALGLAVAVVAVLARAYRRGPVAAVAGAEDLVIYKDQLAEIDRDLARGTITADEAARLRTEVGRRVLEADRARNAEAPVPQGDSGVGIVGLAGAAVVVLGGAVALYQWLGAPGYPDLPLEARLARIDAGIAARPAQVEELTRLGVPRDPAIIASVTADLARISDPDALREAFATRFQAGDLHGAVLTVDRLLALLGDKAVAADHANRALALVAEAQGYVSPEAEDSLRAALSLDLSNELSRYLVGEMFLQGGRFDQTFRFWRPLVEDGDPNSPWVGLIRERIGTVAELAGVAYDPPALAGPGEGDIAAAAGMSPEDRQAMIEGMVAQLSDRLATEGGTVEEWEQLIRALAVLERLPEAQTIYDEAIVRFEGQPAELSFLRQTAVETGLNP